jgi:hypothetical protein
MVRESCLGKRSRLVLTLGLALAGVALLGASLGCGVASTTATQAAASTTTLASVTTTLSTISIPETTTSLALAATTTVSATQPTLAILDRHDPESVLRAYFSAWQNGDWDGEASFMADMYAHMEPEPVKSLRIVDLRRVEGSPSQCLYAVTFDFVPKGDLISMEAGRYDWTYDLSWDEARQSWIITNYGEG